MCTGFSLPLTGSDEGAPLGDDGVEDLEDASSDLDMEVGMRCTVCKEPA